MKVIIKFCDKCSKPITSLQYYEDLKGEDILCNSCGNELLTEHLDFGNNHFVLNEDCKNSYTDDEISDLKLFNKKELNREEIEEVIEFLIDEIDYYKNYSKGLEMSLKNG